MLSLITLCDKLDNSSASFDIVRLADLLFIIGAFFCYKLLIPPAEPVVYWFTNNKKDCGKMKRHSLFVIYIFEKCCQGVRS